MGGGELAVRRVGEVDIEGLRLADEGSAAASELDQLLLRNFPDGFVNIFEVGW